MGRYDQATARVMNIADTLLQHKSDATFGASSIADMALRMSDGDPDRAEKLLAGLDTYLSLARIELRRRSPEPAILDMLSGLPATTEE